MGSFNGTLDSTVAIIIPVLFLALGVQRHLYQDLLQAYYNAARELRQRARPGTRMVPPLLITVVTGAVTTFILVYGTVGEVDAISARPGAARVPGAPSRRPGLRRRRVLLAYARGGDRPDGQRAQHLLGR
jgi:hypothetical protein